MRLSFQYGLRDYIVNEKVCDGAWRCRLLSSWQDMKSDVVCQIAIYTMQWSPIVLNEPTHATYIFSSGGGICEM